MSTSPLRVLGTFALLLLGAVPASGCGDAPGAGADGGEGPRLNTGTPFELLRVTAAGWSPDGRRVAWVIREARGRRIRSGLGFGQGSEDVRTEYDLHAQRLEWATVSPEGALGQAHLVEEVDVLTGGSALHSLAGLPGGGFVLFRAVGEDQLRLERVEDAGTRPIGSFTALRGAIVPSPDGKRLALLLAPEDTSQPATIVVVDPVTGREEARTSEGALGARHLVWDRKGVLYKERGTAAVRRLRPDGRVEDAPPTAWPEGADLHDPLASPDERLQVDEMLDDDGRVSLIRLR